LSNFFIKQFHNLVVCEVKLGSISMPYQVFYKSLKLLFMWSVDDVVFLASAYEGEFESSPSPSQLPIDNVRSVYS